MPVTARLSKLFYERLGEQVVNELVEWFNQVDASYKFDLREMNEQNFARFDAKLEQRLAELGAELRTEFRQGLGELRSELKADIAGLDKRMDVGFANTKVWVEQTVREQTRWFIAASGALAAAQVALVALIVAMLTRLP